MGYQIRFDRDFRAHLKGPVHIYAACGYLHSHASVTQLMGALALPDEK